MFERFRNRPADQEAAGPDSGNGRTAVAERPGAAEGATTADRPAADEPAPRTRERAVPARGTAAGGAGTVATREHLRTARVRQREEYGGVNWGAAFFGWLVAIGLGVLLVAIVAAAGAAVGLTEVSEAKAKSNVEEIGLGGGIVLLVVLLIAYYCGGYVAGRMSRFDGARQGFGAWLLGVIVTLALALAAVVLGDQYNVLEQLNLPSLPVGESTLTTGGAIALAAIVVGTLLVAIVGGKAGERYHRKVDRVGFVD